MFTKKLEHEGSNPSISKDVQGLPWPLLEMRFISVPSFRSMMRSFETPPERGALLVGASHRSRFGSRSRRRVPTIPRRRAVRQFSWAPRFI